MGLLWIALIGWTLYCVIRWNQIATSRSPSYCGNSHSKDRREARSVNLIMGRTESCSYRTYHGRLRLTRREIVSAGGRLPPTTSALLPLLQRMSRNATQAEADLLEAVV